ncbi:MAG: bifunctional phosphoribosylaminoimidazolecarboxamide formyltransferase/IMP cyclohydrolase [Alphaproteobacteria bacterium]|nr:bifunctional phosphoribosylaminoimidazolecarboxamide formyltransferase/IMP cyclohydrolase [Alphaproteobacteria bacterium]
MTAQQNPIRRALISVSDKTGLAEFAKFLVDNNVEILSTGGTANAMRDVGISVKDVSEHTGFPEMMDGRVKTLHPIVHGGLLGMRNNPDHQKAMEDNKITPIDLVVVNLYPFEETVAKGAAFEDCIENIDIGGPAMIRSAAKNHVDVTVVVNIEDYQKIMDDMSANSGSTTLELRRELAAAAYSRTGAYDAAISGWFNIEAKVTTPKHIAIGGELKQTLRYGENPHQSAAFYLGGGASRLGVATATQLQGKELSYNNLNDTDAAFELVSEFEQPAIAIIKHANPCGVASGSSMAENYCRALQCDSVSAFGGIVALNRTLDEETALEISKVFTEVVIAPEIDDAAKKVLSAKKNLRLLVTGGMPKPAQQRDMLKMLSGSFLVQDVDTGGSLKDDLKIVTERAPTDQEVEDMLIAFTVAKHVKSNAIIYVKDGATVGIGAGQMSRVDAARIAISKAEDAAEKMGLSETLIKGSVVASDAFYPFADGLLAAAEGGAIAAIQPGGSIRDEEVIAAANERGMAMAFTGMRHFRH